MTYSEIAKKLRLKDEAHLPAGHELAGLAAAAIEQLMEDNERKKIITWTSADVYVVVAWLRDMCDDDETPDVEVFWERPTAVDYQDHLSRLGFITTLKTVKIKSNYKEVAVLT